MNSPHRTFSNVACAVVAGALVVCGAFASLLADDAKVLPGLSQRFNHHGGTPVESETGKFVEIPSFQKHVGPLLGRLGCNGRACHGSFQGRGGFQLSLFGYDFQADYESLKKDGEQRINFDKPTESLILTKPVSDDLHEGGERFKHGGWEYWVLRSWLEAKAPFEQDKIQKLKRLDVTPREIVFQQAGEKQQLKAIAHWEDGTIEDVTCICRFQTNDPATATVDESGLVTSGAPGDTHVVAFYDNAVSPVPVLRPLSKMTGEQFPQLVASTNIDRLVLAKLKKLGVVPSDVCADAEFLRRASLDATGTLPTATEIDEFTNDTSSEKRKAKINELLGRPGYAAQWATFFCDMTGNNDDQLRNFLPQRIQPAPQWYQWIYHRLEQNMPYDQIVEGIVTAKSRLENESYGQYCEAMTAICQDETGKKFAERPGLVHFWARVNFRTEEERAIGFAYSFLGVRIQCAQCHKHPFDQWSKADFENFQRLFAGIQANQNTMANDARKEYSAMIESLGVDKSLKGNQLRRALGDLLAEGKTIPFPELTVRETAAKGKGKGKGKKEQPAPAKQAKLLGGDWIDLDSEDVRSKLVQWLRLPNNPYFARALVNRVWTQYFGYGIVNPSDDLNLANAPSNEELMNYLAEGFVANKYDLKWLHAEIMNSDTYQRSWVPNDTNQQDKRNFSHAILRRLPAEAAYDATWMALASDQAAEQVVKLGRSRALTIAGASAQANRGNDDTGYALSVFGRSVRETNCDCDRSNEPSLLQTVFMLNDKLVHEMLRDSDGWVASVAQKYGWGAPAKLAKTQTASSEMPNKIAPPLTLAAITKQIERVTTRKQEAQSGGKTDLVGQLENRLTQLMRQKEKLIARESNDSANKDGEAQDATPPAGAEDVPSQPGNQSLAARISFEQARWIASQAYLRSVSRMPTESELVTATNYLTAESNPTIAVEGLLWSLVNTKEFILNH